MPVNTENRAHRTRRGTRISKLLRVNQHTVKSHLDMSIMRCTGIYTHHQHHNMKATMSKQYFMVLLTGSESLLNLH